MKLTSVGAITNKKNFSFYFGALAHNSRDPIERGSFQPSKLKKKVSIECH